MSEHIVTETEELRRMLDERQGEQEGGEADDRR